MSHYYTVIQPKSGLFPYCSIKVLSDNSRSFEHGSMGCLKIECLKCGRTYSPCCEPADCKVFEAENIAFSDAEMEEISRIIRDYKEKRKCLILMTLKSIKKCGSRSIGQKELYVDL